MRRDPRCSDELLGLAERLIAIESHKDAPGREAEVGRFLVDWFRDRGVEAKLEPVEDGRSNVVARVAGGSGSKLILSGHLDTVPAGDMEGAFAPRIEDGVLWGRGACDMKGAIASMACALVEIGRVRGGAPLQGDLLFAGTVDEESGGLGVKALVDSGIGAGYAVVGEPTALRVAVAHKGACFVRVSLVGRGAHGSCPEQGVNAALYAARIVAAIEDGLRPALARRTHRLLGPSTVNVGRICGGTQPNIVAERCEIDIDRRYLPGEASPLAEIREIVDAVCAGVEGLRCDIEEMPMTSIVPHVPLETSPRSRLAEGAIAACAELGLPPEPVGVTYWSDGGHLAARGIETVVLGPGAIADAHGPRDRVAVDELVAAVELYRRIAARLL